MERSMENGFASPRTESFPAGLRVLVVDDDPTWLKILEKMLKRCSYEVTTCCLARDALDLLRERRDGFDIVISDVNMPDMDGFKLLEHVGLEMDLPVIMMSVDGETSRVMKGVQHGACDYLLKPVRMKELKNIWQHVVRKKIHELKDIESYEGNEDILLRNGSDRFDDGHFLFGGDLSSAKKRKEIENRDYDDQEYSDHSSVKKARVVWSVDLHQKFVNAVNQIGFDIGPKKILDLMNVPWLTRENVASHLQKYRLYLSRLQKPNDPKTALCGIKQQDFVQKDPSASFAHQSSITVHQNSAASCSYGYSSNNLLVQDAGSEIHEGDLKGIISFLPGTEPRKTLNVDLPSPRKSNGSQMSLTRSFGSPETDASNISFETTIPQKHAWSREVPIMQLKQQPKQEHELYGYSHLPLPSQHHNIGAESLQPRLSSQQHNIRAESLHPGLPSQQPNIRAESLQPRLSSQQHIIRAEPLHPGLPSQQPNIRAESLHPGSSINLGTSITEIDKSGPFQIKPPRTEYRSNAENISPTVHIIDPLQAETKIVNPQDFGAIPTINTELPSMKHHSFTQPCTSTWESDQRNIIPGIGSTLFSSQEGLQLGFLQDYAFVEDAELNNIEFLNYQDPDLFADVPTHLYDRLKFNNDYLCESTLEYPIMDQGLFIA